MNHKRISTIYKYSIILVGSFALVYAGVNLSERAMSIGFVVFLLTALFITPFMSLKLPRTKVGLSFSDSLIFLGFMIYGGSAAALIAASGMLALCFRMKWKGLIIFRPWMIPCNIAASTISTLVTTSFAIFLFGKLNVVYQSTDTNALIQILGVLAVFHFLFSSVLHIPLSRNIGQVSLWNIWKTEYLPISFGQIAGAVLAFIIYKLVYQSSVATGAIALVLLGFVYINYRRTISDINESIKQAEKAEREKALIAKAKAQEAEEHASQLEKLLENEEAISRDLRQSKDELEYSAYHDALTDLPNRAYLMERLKFLIELGADISKDYYILFLDLNRFKNINDSLGHSVGDQVLKIVALRLRRLLRDEDTITRLGGDEFAIILTNLSSMEKARKVANKIYESVTRPFMIQGNKIFSDLHVGIAPLDFEHIKPEDIVRDADIAMQHAKDKNIGIAIFDKNIRSNHLERIRLEADLRSAVEREEFTMNYQPLISLQTGHMVGFEALIRWTHPELGFISPGQFIPISEDSGSIIPITNWLLVETCTQMARWNQLLPADKQIYVSVNISGRHLSDDDLVGDVKRALRLSGLPATLLKLEITESTAMDNAERTIQILQNLNNLGVQLSIDDFGTGYSSLSYLHRLPFDTLKIDRSFVVNADRDEREDLNILETIVALTKNLGKKVIAEGIETEKQLSLLQSLNCDFGQGYLFSKPLPKKEAGELLANLRPWLEFHDQKFAEGVSNLNADKSVRPF